MGALKKVAAGAFAERLAGGGPAPRVKSLVTSAGVGIAVSVLVYRFLRSGDDASDEGDGSAAEGGGEE